MRRALAAIGTLTFSLWTSAVAQSTDEPRTMAVQSRFPPLFLADAPKGGAHPIGGPAFRFHQIANDALAPTGLQLTFHTSGEVTTFDEGRVDGPVVSLDGSFETLHHAVAAGAVDASIGLANMNGQPFGELLVAALPFGLEPDEFIGWLYRGGGLALQQELYDEAFEQNLVVLPVGVTSTQGGGWFPTPLPDPTSKAGLDGESAMRDLCQRGWIVRWPQPGADVWRRACAEVGVATQWLGEQTRCQIAADPCPTDDNPVVNLPESLSFGGFVPGGLPQNLVRHGQIDAWELNLPLTDALMMKHALGFGGQPTEDVDLSPVIERAPYYYGGTWHQPLSYIELIINRSIWDQLSETQQTLLRIAAKAATLDALSAGMAAQDEGIRILQSQGAVIDRWPEPLLARLRTASEAYLDEKAAVRQRANDDAYARVLTSMRRYAESHRAYHDFGDINQGRWFQRTTGSP